MLGKKCLITGGTGSLGTAILERAERENWDTQFTVIARNETKINQTKARFPHVDSRVGDIGDYDFLRTLFAGYDCVVHAAAQKVVPLAESNVRNSIITNVMGTMNVCQAAVDAKVSRVVNVLTDKMCMSTTVYGATKFLASAIGREANTWGDTSIVGVRYGNVIGSNNSILPQLLKQKAEGKPFTITNARCTRFWLKMDEAIDLIIRAANERESAHTGITFVPKAPASKVLDLFHAVDPDWPVVDIGIRTGEKIHEQLIDEIESRHTWDFGDYFIVFSPHSTATGNLPDGYGYYSNNSAQTLSVDDLREMLGV